MARISALLSHAGDDILAELYEGGSMVIAAVNEHIPQSKHLPMTATGNEVNAVIQTLGFDKQNILYTKHLDLEIAQEASWAQIQMVMDGSDAKGDSKIAWLIAASIIIFNLGYTVGMLMVINGSLKADSLPSWEQIFVILVVPTALLRSYLILREHGKQNRARVAMGVLPIVRPTIIESITTWLSNRNTN